MSRSHPGRAFGKTIFSLFCASGTIALAVAAAGCGTTLEDGYKPRAIGSSPEARKSYYASPFTEGAEAKSHGGGAPGIMPGAR